MTGNAAIHTRFLPGPRLVWLAFAALPAYALGTPGLVAGAVFMFALLLAALYEARALRQALPAVSRKLDARLLVGLENEVEIRLHNASRLRLRAELRDDYPSAFRVERDSLQIELGPHARESLRYQVVPSRRGRFRFQGIHLRIEGLLGLGTLSASYEAPQAVRVYPNLRGPRRYELAARLGALRSVGVRAVRRPGGGGEFEQLREYVSGDSYRDLDWKATAKRRRPVTRVHGQEQSQNVIVALDAGRMMGMALEQLTKLDHAINAALLLAYVALRSGDKVGAIVFAERVQCFVPPRRGHAQYRRILEALSTIEASPTYVDFPRLCEFVRARIPRRSLLVIFSDLLDESQAMPLSEQAPLLRRKHLLLCASMTDPVAETLAHARAETDEQAYHRAAASTILEDRDAIKLHIRKSGVGLVEAPAAELAIHAVNRYLEIKNKHVL